MKNSLCLAFVFIGSLCSVEAQTNNQPSTVHSWEYLIFSNSDFFIHYAEPKPGYRSGLQLTIDTRLDPEFFKTNAITARIYQPDGTILEPTDEDKKLLNLPMYITTGVSDIHDKLAGQQVMTFLPWGTNALDDEWIEVSIGSERYWLEIPYGLGRNPEDPLPPSIPAGSPKFVSAMHPGDHIVRWWEVQYNLGQIQNGWFLRLNLLNTTEPRAEVRLYKDPDEAIKSPWTTNSPQTTVHVFDSKGKELNGRFVNTYIEGGRFWRTDTFRFDRYENNTRSWGRIEISVDDKTCQTIIPSSLYKYSHGHASN